MKKEKKMGCGRDFMKTLKESGMRVLSTMAKKWVFLLFTMIQK
jgi:hypothetical protein